MSSVLASPSWTHDIHKVETLGESRNAAVRGRGGRGLPFVIQVVMLDLSLDSDYGAIQQSFKLACSGE